jgi:hypothetical protein
MHKESRKKTLTIQSPIEIELKLVQDTRINPDVIHLYLKGCDHPIMQFGVVNGKLTFYRINGLDDARVANHETKSGHPVIAEAKDVLGWSWPTSAEAFGGDDERTSETSGTTSGCR